MSPTAVRRPAGPRTVAIACLAAGFLLVAAVAVVGLTWIRAAITDQVEDAQRLFAEERAELPFLQSLRQVVDEDPRGVVASSGATRNFGPSTSELGIGGNRCCVR